MRFPKTWQRRKGGSGSVPVLDTTAPTTTPPNSTNDNVLSCKFWSTAGWPVQRIAAGWTTTASTPTALNGSLYVWEWTLGQWLLVNGTAVSMNANQLYYFDVPAIMEPTPNSNNVAQASGGSLDCMLLVEDPGSQVNGTFTIAMAPDCSTIGT